MPCEIPSWTSDARARLEAVFDGERAIDEWSAQLLDAGAHLAGLLLDLERAGPRTWPRRRPDGAAPLIGSSDAIRRVRERIEKIAPSEFSILIEGAIGPESHPGFIEVSA